ncbi:hypothetical protein ACMFMG_005458 [Clarireedia jacksonii]
MKTPIETIESEKNPPVDNPTDVSIGQLSASLSPAEDRRLTMKLDIKLIPILGLLYLICFLDRTNIANAKIAGLEAGLDMPTNGYNTALWIFYIPFVLAEVPSNMIMSLPWIKPNVWLGAQTFILGLLAMCQGLTHSYEGLLAIRFLMGIVETGLPAGAGLLIASYYRKKEVGLRFAIFLACGEAGSCFSGLLAYAIADLDGAGGYEGWRWIFIIEGLITVFFAVFVFIFTTNFPVADSWLKDSDKAALLSRLENDRGEEKTTLGGSNWKKVILDYKVWLVTGLFFCADTSAGSLSAFNPTILSQLGWKSRRAQVMTIPVWVTGIVGALGSCLLSDRLNIRWPFIFLSQIVAIIGWVIHYCQMQPSGVRYFAQFMISFGTFVTMPLYMGLLMTNLRGRASIAFGSAVQFGFGNCANFVSSNIFISSQAPQYPVGFSTGLGITAASVPLMMLVIVLFRAHNKKVEAKEGAGERIEDR